MRRTLISITYLLTFSLILIGCGGSNQQAQLKDLPEICRYMDLSADPELAETCGIRQTRYKSYKNIPPQRYLIRPKGTSIVKTEKGAELRLPNTIPVELDKEIATDLDFSEDSKSKLLKNEYLYEEIFPKNGKRLRLFKLGIPVANKMKNYCFSVPRSQVDKRVKAMSGHTVFPITCEEFQRLVDTHK